MYVLGITTLSWMRSHHTSQHLYAILAGTDTRDYHLEQHPKGACFSEKFMKYSKIHQFFGIEDDMLVVGYDSDGKDHDETLQQVLQICRQVNLKLNKDKCHFRCTSVPFFGEVISRHGVQPCPQ